MTRSRIQAGPTAFLGAFFAICLIYGFGVRQNREQFAAPRGLQINAWDVVMSTLGDPYLIVYLCAPVLLGASVLRVKTQAMPHVMLRYGSRAQWLIAQAIDALALLVPYVVAILTAACVAGWGLDWTPRWASASLSTDQPNELLRALTRTGTGPLTSAGQQIILLVCAGTVIVTAMSALYLLWSRDVPMVVIAAIGFVVLVVSFKTSWPLSEFVRPVNYLLTSHAQKEAGTLAGIFTLMGAATVLLIVGTATAERLPRSRRPRWPSETSIPTAAYACLVAAGLVATNANYADGRDGLADGTVTAFYGATSDGVSFIPLLFSIIVMVGFGYLTTTYMTYRLSERFYYELIRRGSLTRWAVRLTGRLLVATATCLGSLWVVNALVFKAVAGTGPQAADMSISIATIAHQFFLNGALQLMVYAVAAVVAIWATGRTASGLVVIGAAAVLTLPVLNPGGYLPSGLAAMGIATQGGDAVWHSTIVLATWLVLLSASLLLLFRYKDPSFE